MGSVVIQLYAGECTPSVDRALKIILSFPLPALRQYCRATEILLLSPEYFITKRQINFYDTFLSIKCAYSHIWTHVIEKLLKFKSIFFR